jgi:hypothetical protein
MITMAAETAAMIFNFLVQSITSCAGDYNFSKEHFWYLTTGKAICRQIEKSSEKSNKNN